MTSPHQYPGFCGSIDKGITNGFGRSSAFHERKAGSARRDLCGAVRYGPTGQQHIRHLDDVVHVVDDALSNNTLVMITFLATGNKGTDGTGTGDVVGPASATDNALVRFDTTTGKKIKVGGALQTAEIGDAQVTLAKLANIAAARLLGRATAGSGVAEELTAAQAKTLLALAKADVGLGSVDNTADTAKPVSTAQQTALNTKVNKAGDTLTGALVLAGAPTIDLHAATKKYVDDKGGGAVLTAAVPTTSGTAIDLTGIPATAKKITMTFSGVSVATTSPIMVQLGTSGGVDATGYAGVKLVFASAAVAASNLSAGFEVGGGSNGGTYSGTMTITLQSNNTWVELGVLGRSDVATTGNTTVSTASKTLAGALDRLRLTTVAGTAAFSGGSVALLIE